VITQPVLDVGSPIEGERACEVLRSHGIMCNWASVPLLDGPRSGPVFSVQERFVVMVAAEDVELAQGFLKGWRAG